MDKVTPSNSAIIVEECMAVYDELMSQHNGQYGKGPGHIKLLGWDLEYISGMALAAFIDCGLIRRIGDFHADNEAPLILDCGSNIGCTVLNYKRLFPQARIVAFEPDPQFAPILRRNLELNGAQDVTVIEAAVWTDDCELGWFCEGADGSRVVNKSAQSESARVRAVDLAQYISEPVDLLKVDIEGAEFHVIPHLGERLRNVKNILVECHMDQNNILGLCRMCEILAGTGFRLGINTYGPWRDLVRQPLVQKNHWEQYALVAGWRDAAPQASSEATFLPYLGVPLIRLEWNNKQLQLENAQALKQVVLDLAGSQLTGRRQKVRVQPLKPPFNCDGGFCWTQATAELLARSDDLENPQRSMLLLLEDENLLGPAHSLHDEIRAQGEGRFSHWDSKLYFSSSDGTNPNTSGKNYAIIYWDMQVGED
jgi:FkbM family methyltransferase